jgi:hypothetical protein
LNKRTPKIIHILINKKDCWEWQGCRNKDGYANAKIKGTNKTRLVSRIVLEYKLCRPLTPKMQACHTCDNPPCVNPDHLFEATQLQNIADRDKKLRTNKPRGSRNGSAKLTDDNVREIKILLKSQLTQKEISKRFNICEDTIQRINSGTKWSHIECPEP